MSTAPQKLPPLEVLTYAAAHGLWGLGAFGKQIIGAREVFAELIEADREFDAANAAYSAMTAGTQRNAAWDRVLAAKERRQAALSAFGGDA